MRWRSGARHEPNEGVKGLSMPRINGGTATVSGRSKNTRWPSQPSVEDTGVFSLRPILTECSKADFSPGHKNSVASATVMAQTFLTPRVCRNPRQLVQSHKIKQ